MTNKDLANLIFPNITKTIEDYRKIYPARNLSEGAKVTRFAPSPTGFVHLGGLYQAIIDMLLAKSSNGIFYLRNEDTDKVRELDGALKLILDTLKYYQIMPNEYQDKDKVIGDYGPYTQSERKEIYHAFIKYFIEIGRAYPCFCSKEKLEKLRENQNRDKVRTGYYGKYATCKNMSIEEAADRIKNGEEYIIRFRSLGDNDKRFKFNDLVKGEIEFPENDLDIVIMKADGLPTYHFAHLVDDYLMGTTHVVRGEEWLSSVPVHIELFKTLGVKPPKYIHTPLIMKKDGDIVRKISKRKDPEASMSYYKEHGYPIEAVIESLMTIINSNYEEWHTANPDKSYLDFQYSPKKMSSSGALYDLDKLSNISKNIISRMTKEELCEKSYEWAESYSSELKRLIEQDKNYYMNILNIEREQKKPRKDIAKYDEIIDNIWYMYDELFENKEKAYEYQTITDKEEIKKILVTYMDKYFELTDKDVWFNNMKALCDELGYASNMKDYKQNPENYKGSVADVSTVLRVALTTKCMTPDLYEIMKLLGKERIEKRYHNIKNIS
ncbi:MAG: glutamate--tRNA ligase [Erysipelotrichaceae bacterium]|nr:glutamate--tRNA ligase [Erysipelotrichaceae bacterium]